MAKSAQLIAAEAAARVLWDELQALRQEAICERPHRCPPAHYAACAAKQAAYDAAAATRNALFAAETA